MLVFVKSELMRRASEVNIPAVNVGAGVACRIVVLDEQEPGFVTVEPEVQQILYAGNSFL